MKGLNKFKILLFACLLFICAISLGQSGPTPLIQINTDQIVDGAVSAIKTDGSIALTADVYNRVEIDSKLGSLVSDLAAGNKLYYCSSGTEDIDGITYGELTEIFQPEVSSVAIGPIEGTTYAQYSPGRGRITPQLGVTQIPAGIYNRVSHMSNSNTSGRNVEIVYELWRADSAGTKISLIATSSVQLIDSPTGNAIQRLDNEYAVSAPVDLDPTDRLLEEFFFRRVGITTGTDPTITRYIGGSRAGFLNLALPSGVVMRTDGSNADDLVDLPNRVRAVFASVTTDLDVGGDVNIEGDLTGVNASFTGVVEADGVELMKKDGSNASTTVAFPGDITGVNASFTGAVEAGGVELMMTDGSNAADLVDLPNRVRAVFASITTDLDIGGDVGIGGDLAGVNASFTGAVTLGDLDIEGDLTGVNASFTGAVEADGVELMKNDGSNSAAAVTLKDLELTGNLIGVDASFTGDVSAGGSVVQSTTDAWTKTWLMSWSTGLVADAGTATFTFSTGTTAQTFVGVDVEVIGTVGIMSDGFTSFYRGIGNISLGNNAASAARGMTTLRESNTGTNVYSSDIAPVGSGNQFNLILQCSGGNATWRPRIIKITATSNRALSIVAVPDGVSGNN